MILRSDSLPLVAVLTMLSFSPEARCQAPQEEFSDQDVADLVRASELSADADRLSGERKYAEAIAKTLEVSDIRKRILGEYDHSYAASLISLAQLYRDKWDYARAEPLYLRATDIFKRTLGEDDTLFAANLSGLASFYDSMGDYGRAEPLYLQVAEIRKRAWGEDDPNYAASLNNLAALYVRKGDYARAEPLYLQATDIWKRTWDEDGPGYTASLHGLALLYGIMGDYARAEPLFRQTIEIKKRTLGEDDPSYAATLNNLALLYTYMRDYARAEPLYRQGTKILKQTQRENHPDYAATLNNLALLYTYMGDYARAEPLYLQATEIRKRALGENHPDCAASLNNLALLYDNMGDYARAEPLYVQSTETMKRTLGENHPDYAASLSNLAFLYVAMDRADEAESLYRQALAISRSSLEATATIQSERQQLAMGQSLRHQLDSYLSLGLNADQYAREIFAEVLLWKGSTLVRQRGMRLAGEDPAVLDLFAQLQRTATQLASLSRAVPGDETQQQAWRARLTELTHDKERLEAQLSTKSAAFRAATKQVTFDDLLAALPQDAVLVDYLEFTRSTPPKKPGDETTWTRELVAFVVRHANKPEDQVVMVSLGPVAPVAAAINSWRATFGVGEDAAAAGIELRKLVWEPVSETTNDERGTMNDEPRTTNSGLSPPTTHHPPLTLLVSADGVLGRMPLGALPGAKPGTYLIADHRLAMIPVPQLLPTLMAAEDRPLSHELLLLGDVDYDAIPGAAPAAKPTAVPGDVQLAYTHRSSGLRAPTAGIEQFSRLPGTKGEVEAIERLFRAARPSATCASLGTTDATEARFRELAPQCRCLHLATHGFFSPERFKLALAADSANPRPASFGEQESSVVGYSPNLLSGLVFAGANRPPRDDGDDGILTAEEIASLQLEGARLVTLSACETGLGETAGGEGLLGLQRAFQVSGARTTIASFWNVDDQVTRALMERFYRNLHTGPNGKPLPMLDALREAQLWILKNPQDVAAALRSRGADVPEDDPDLMTSPRYWAAFTLSGDWR